MKFLKKQPPARLIAAGFFIVMLIGAVLLSLPLSRTPENNMSFLDCIYTSTSAVCVTGLAVADTGASFTGFGQAVLCLLVQIGGLGVASVGAGVIMAIGRKVNMKGRALISEGANFGSGKGAVKFLRRVLAITFITEFIGAVCSFFVFIKDYSPLRAIWYSVFHSIAAFNNAGFDILGTGTSLYVYKDNVAMNLITSLLVIIGGIGFLVIMDLRDNRLNFKKLTLHSKVVLTMAAVLLVGGTVLLKLTEGFSWMSAFFASMTARTAGFATDPYSTFSSPGLLIVCILMFIGASSGSTGGGIKTGTMFVLFHGIRSAATGKKSKAFKWSIPKDAFYKAAVITLMGFFIVVVGTVLTLVFEKDISVMDALFEMVSAFGTVGLTTGITGSITAPTKLLTVLIMFTGRLGPLTMASLWHFKGEERAEFPEGNLPVG